MHNWIRQEPLTVTMQRLVRYGYQGVQLSAGEAPPADEVRRILREYGIWCSGVAASNGSIIAADESERAQSVEECKRAVRLAAELDAGFVCLVPDLRSPTPPAGVTAEEEWQWAVEALRAVHEDADRLGVRLALEPCNRFETYFATNLEQALELAKAVGPACGLSVDTFHLNIEETDPFASIAEFGPYIYDVHVADTNRLAPGMGHWDWARLVSALDGAGYTGGLSVEFIPDRHRTPPPASVLSAEEEILHGANDELTEEAFCLLTERSATTLLPLLAG